MYVKIPNFGYLLFDFTNITCSRLKNSHKRIKKFSGHTKFIKAGIQTPAFFLSRSRHIFIHTNRKICNTGILFS